MFLDHSSALHILCSIDDENCFHLCRYRDDDVLVLMRLLLLFVCLFHCYLREGNGDAGVLSAIALLGIVYVSVRTSLCRSSDKHRT
jgi:hypothetical protein